MSSKALTSPPGREYFLKGGVDDRGITAGESSGEGLGRKRQSRCVAGLGYQISDHWQPVYSLGYREGGMTNGLCPLRLEGDAPSSLQVRVSRRDGSLAYDYTAPVYNGRLHLPLLPEEVDADISARAVSGANQEVFYSRTTSEMKGLFDLTRDADCLDAVSVPPGAGTPPETEGSGLSAVPPAADQDDFLPPTGSLPRARNRAELAGRRPGGPSASAPEEGEPGDFRPSGYRRP